MWTATLLVSLALSGALARKDYSGYKVVDVFPQTTEHLEYLQSLQLNENDLDFWREPGHMTGGQQGTVMMPGAKVTDFLDKMATHQIDYTIRDVDVHQQVEEEHERIVRGRQQRVSAGQKAFNYNDYNTYQDFMDEIDNMVANCPSGVTCTNSSIGTTVGGRVLKTLVISTGSGRKAYWLDSLIHAREWIAGATMMSIVNHMLTNYGSDSTVTNMMNTYDFHFLPVVNPDGYEFSHNSDRYWRKNRGPNAGSACLGTDCNRNFDYLWGQEGVSFDPCSSTFCGATAASEREVQAVQNAISAIGASNTMAVITIHSYAYIWLFPFSDTLLGVCRRADDHADLMAVADAAADATMNTHGTDLWDRGNGCETLGAVTGATDEWAKGAASVKYAYTIELRGRDFVIAPSNIPLSFQEIWNGLVAFVNAVAANPPSSA